MRNGIYALASLDGAPLAPPDLDALGLSESGSQEGHLPANFHVAPGFAARLFDAQAPGAADWFKSSEVEVGFLGYLDESEELCRLTGWDDDSSPARLALAALERFGSAAADRMLGEWGFIRWDARLLELTVLTSETLRDPLYFATDGRRVALAPEMLTLSRLGWVGKALDPEGLALMMSRAGLRPQMKYETVWKGISQILPATREVFAAGQRRSVPPSARPAPKIWTGNFKDAIENLDIVGRHIVGQQMERYQKTAFLLSGGLDSTLLTSLGAQEQRTGREMFCVSSVAPAGSDMADEREFSGAAAKRLGIPIHFICPPENSSVFRPANAVFEHLQHPMTGVRHYLYEALFAAARAQGARAVVDGVYGELSITNGAHLDRQMFWARQAVGALRAWMSEKRSRESWRTAAFHAFLSDEVLNGLPGEWESVWKGRKRPRDLEVTGSTIGFHPALGKNAMIDTSTASGLRNVMPYRDRRLLRAAASLPASYLRHEGVTRALPREMLKGRVSDAVRLRPRGLPFSPDYEGRLRVQAVQAQYRIELFRDAGLGEWVNLELLSTGLTQLAAGHPASVVEMFRIQLTAILAEFLLWQQNA